MEKFLFSIFYSNKMNLHIHLQIAEQEPAVCQNV